MWSAGDALPGGIERFLRRHPLPSLSREEVAAHEAGHFVLSARLGLGPLAVEIWGKDERGWDGGTSFPGPPFFNTPINPRGGADVLWRVAAGMLAGPIAEDLRGSEGRAVANIGELIAANAWACKPAELSGRDREEVGREVLAATICFIENSGETRNFA